MLPKTVNGSPIESPLSRPVNTRSHRQAGAALVRAASGLTSWIDRHGALTVIIAYGATLAASLYLSGYLFWPSIFPDEGQYAIVGQNLIRYGVFEYRGDFPLLIPPGYPLVIAIGRLLAFGTTSIVPIFVLNHILMVGVVFPAFGMARQLNLRTYIAVLIAVAAAWVPDMSFANHYMAEALYYPVFILACYVGARFFLEPTPWSAMLTGGVLGLALLTKNTALALLIAFAAASMWGACAAVLRRRFAGDRVILLESTKRYILWPGLAVLTAIAVYAPWLLLRQRNLGGCIACGGEAGSISRAKVAPGILLHLFSMYASDIFLNVNALALLPVIAACAVLLVSTPSRQCLGVYWAGAIVTVTAMAAIYSGAIASRGDLIDRHLFVIFPVILVLAAGGIGEMHMVPRAMILVASLLSSAALVYGLYQYDFRIDAFYSASWIYGFGRSAEALFGNATWSPEVFFVAIAIFVFAAQGIWLLGRRQHIPIFVATVLVVNAVGMTTVFGTLTWQGPGRLTPYNGPGALAQWVMERIPQAQPLLAMGVRNGAQPLVPSFAPDLELLDEQYAYGESGTELDYLEAAGLYDIRIVPQLALLPAMQQETRARYLLSPIGISGLHSMGQWGQDVLYDLRGTTLVGMIPAAIHYSTASDFYKEDLHALVAPSTVKPNGLYLSSIRVRNGSSASIWKASGIQTVGVSYHWWKVLGGLASGYYGILTPLPGDLAPGQSTTVQFGIQTPSQPGDYLLEIDLTQLQNGSAFASEGGIPLTTLVHVHN